MKKEQRTELRMNGERPGASQRKKKRIRTLQMLVWTVMILVEMSVVRDLEVYAEEAVVTRQVEQEIRYDDVEGAAEIPQQVDIRVLEEDQEATAVCELQELVEESAKWQEGFVLPVTFHVYGADGYMLGDHMILHNEEAPQLQGYEEELLTMTGLSPEEYRIETISWDGGIYTDENGEMCRDAAARGQKLVRSYRAKYTGTAVIPVPDISRITLVYEEPVQTKEAESETSESEAAPEPAGIITEPPEREGGRGQSGFIKLLEQITRTLLVAVGIGTLLFFLGLLFLLGLRMAKSLHVWYINRRNQTEEDK